MEIDTNVACVLLIYSAIDMSTFQALKLNYLRSTGKDEPGVLALLVLGSISGSVGAMDGLPTKSCADPTASVGLDWTSRALFWYCQRCQKDVWARRLAWLLPWIGPNPGQGGVLYMTDADHMDHGALDQLLLHTGTLGSIYHKNSEVRQPCWL